MNAGIALMLLVAVATASDLFLSPPAVKSRYPDAALVFFPEPGTRPQYYKLLLQRVQAIAPFALYVAVPTSTDYATASESSIATLRSLGLHSGATLFYGGHGLGDSGQAFVSTAQNASGLVLLGAVLPRVYNSGFAVPVLTAVGELDGVVTASRVAESFYVHVQAADSVAQAAMRYPVVVIPGANHVQISDAGASAPASITAKDLRSEACASTVRALLAEAVSEFLAVAAPTGVLDMDVVLSSASGLNAFVSSTYDFVQPLVQAMLQEASSRLNPQSETPWVRDVAQPYVAGLNKSLYPLVVSDAQRYNVTNFTYTHPSVTGTCIGQQTPCSLLHGYSVSNPVYNSTDTERTAATEIKAKLSSRQRYTSLTTNASAAVSVDDPDFCGQINALAVSWAKKHAGVSAALRFDRYGQQIVIGGDIYLGARASGPVWVAATLNYTQVQESDETVLLVRAPKLVVPVESAYFPGVHYCKLLSPAFVMEWMYTEGLRLRYALN